MCLEIALYLEILYKRDKNEVKRGGEDDLDSVKTEREDFGAR